jgi:hypothetical protein
MTRPEWGAVVLVDEEAVVVVVVGVPLEGVTARTMRKVAPTKSMTMMKTTLSEGW